jgi:hypothetical protein
MWLGKTPIVKQLYAAAQRVRTPFGAVADHEARSARERFSNALGSMGCRRHRS